MHERNLNIPAVLQSKEPSLMVLRQQRFEELVEFSTTVVAAYLGYCFPAQIGIAGTFAEDLIDQRPDWKAADFILCFKFIRTRQDIPDLKVFGNSITPQRLNEMICVYEEHRAIERERLHNERKGDCIAESRHLQNIAGEIAEKFKSKEITNNGDAELGRRYEQTAAEMEEKRQSPFYKKPDSEPANETWFKENLKSA